MIFLMFRDTYEIYYLIFPIFVMQNITVDCIDWCRHIPHKGPG